MKRKPDLLWILVVILTLGVVTTGYTQSLWERSSAEQAMLVYEPQTMLAPYTSLDQ
ncbi:hypothetical protein TOI97_02015 [Denitrificimonas sp. JX-1]|uniref:Uncharacterized protein n=1 Tax=Denitrificimonas halotolerans TaxID=3098930 RepID=A0ABU5GNQ8_9GAMM|nr:hypothetical protein [Denitrificimonas sp. JX-1]MDY7218359.1 hypothetical protein [Denitrificimonas sp. JX-1]